MRRNSANESPAALMTPEIDAKLAAATSSFRATVKSLDRNSCLGRPLNRDDRYDDAAALSSSSLRSLNRARICKKSASRHQKSKLTWSTMTVECCRSSSAFHLVVVFLFIFNNQVASSTAQQTNRLQQQQQQPSRASWRDGQQTTFNATARSAPNLINRAETAAPRQYQTEDSSHKLLLSNNQNFATSRSQQETRHDALEAAATTSPSSTAMNSETAPVSVAPSDTFELADGGDLRGPSTDQDESQPADEESSDTGSEGNGDDQTMDEGDQSAVASIDRRDDHSDETQVSPSSSSTSSYEGIQLRPSRQSDANNQLAPGELITGGNHGGALTTLRTMNQPDGRNAQSSSSSSSGSSSASRTSTTTTPSPSLITSTGSFDLNMGADRLLIKSADEHETRLLLSRSPSPLPAEQQHRHRQTMPVSSSPVTSTTTTSSVDDFVTRTQQQQQQHSIATTAPAPHNNQNSFHEQLATESVNHHHHELPADSRASAPTSANLNERRLEVANSNNEQFSSSSYPDQSRVVGSQQQQQQQQFIADSQPQHELAVASICYTPFSLLMVILATILITLIVCLSSYYFFKYLKRHQFDLVANSKHFDHKHLSSSSNGYSQGAALSLSSQHQRNNNHLLPLDGACTVHLYQPDERCNKCLAWLGASVTGEQSGRMVAAQDTAAVPSYAFRNPYFTDELHQQANQRQHCVEDAFLSGAAIVRDLSRGRVPIEQSQTRDSPGTNFNCGTSNSSPTNAVGLLRTASSNEQMHFIESHIADLHNRQVTSSVKELSSLGADTTQQVVDLTSEEQQARVRAYPKEGDLVAIDLTGHDIIGLGFDVCGNQRDGIFVRTVSSHGPARESGCIQPGDRIKCVNVSFENMTVQDACDLLNAGSPYKLRLLIEKKIANLAELNKMQQTSNRPTLAANRSPVGQRRRLMMTIQPFADGPIQTDTGDKSMGPLDVTRAYIKRLTSRLRGEDFESQPGSARIHQQMVTRQQVDDFQRLPNQRVMMSTANNPLLMMNQCKQVLPNDDGDGGNLYKLAPIGALATRIRPNETVLDRDEHDFRAADMGGVLASSRGRVAPSGLVDDRQIPRRSSVLSTSEQEQLNNINNDKTTTSVKQDNKQERRPGQHRSSESCHINGAFQADEVDSTSSLHDNRGNGREDKRLNLNDDAPNDMKDANGLHADKHNGEDLAATAKYDDDDDDVGGSDHHQEDAERLYDYERQSKLMASGEAFNSKSRLTM